MKVLDASILLYAYDSASPFHQKARVLLEELFSGREPVGLPCLCVAAFVRISTHPSLKGERLTTDEALEVVDGWMARPQVRLLAPTDRHWAHFRRMIGEGQARGNLVPDAEIASLTLEWGGLLLSPDRDFARFPGLRWTNPLV